MVTQIELLFANVDTRLIYRKSVVAGSSPPLLCELYVNSYKF